MLQTRLTVALVLIGSCFAQIDLECPQDWVKYSKTCFKFTRSPLRTWGEARITCQSYGADLLAVGSPEEHSFIQNWLRENDPQRKQWYTSGADPQSSNIWHWMKDGTLISLEGGWIHDASQSGQVLVYQFSNFNNEWGWNVVDAETPKPYICEVPLEEVPTLKIQERGTDYGLIIADLNLIPRGPSFVVEPQDTVFDQSARSLINDVILRCVAEGYPYPTYKWFRLEYQNEELTRIPILVLVDKRYTLTDGILTINDPDQNKDRGQYFCEASNEFGTIRSVAIQLAFGYVGEFQLKRDPVIANLYSGIGVPCDPPTHFPDLIYYWTRSFPNFVEENQRVFVSYDGHLYISTLESTDAANYSCNVKSTISTIGKTGPLFPLIVEKEQSFGQLLIQTSFPKMFPEAPLAGQNVRIECVANGYPVPSYNWTRWKNKRLPTNARLMNYNRVFYITNVQIEDSDDYVCTASNSRGTVTASVTLNVNAKPIFTVPLENLIVDTGSNIDWTCEAYGKPDVHYTWFKNGIEIFKLTGDKDHILINGNRLSIQQVDAARDNGMYQCEARNVLGAAYSSAQLKVMFMMPSFLKYPLEPLIYVAEGENVTIVCSPEAAPKPDIKWTRNNGPIASGGKFRILPNGNLLIEPVTMGDDGSYKCIASNFLGVSSSSGVLVVRRPPQFISKPVNTQVILNQTATMICEAIADPTLDLTYAWTHNEIKINFDTMGDKFQQGDVFNPIFNRGLLRILNSSFAESGRYKCIAKTPAASISAHAELMVIGPPGPPSGITAKEVSQKNALLRWNDGTNSGGVIKSYKIEGRISHDKEWFTLAEAPQVVSGGSQKEAKLFNLLPFNTYEFRVIARNDFGYGEPSEPSGSYTTPPDAPYLFPRNISGGGGKVGDLTISWDPLPPEHENAAGIGYIVYYKKEEDASMDYKEVKVTDSDRIISLSVGEFYTRYLVKVKAFNKLGNGPESMPVVVYSAENTPTDAPQRIIVRPYNSTALNVTWEPLINTRERMRGELRGYRVKYWPDKGQEADARFTLLKGTRNWGLVVGLRNFTKYWVKVFGYNSAGNGPESEQAQERTLRAAVQMAPTFVTIKNINPTVVSISWRGVTPSEYEEPIDGYRIRYWFDNDDRNTIDRDYPLSYFKDKKELEAKLVNIIPMETYNVRVLAYSRGGDGRMSSPAKQFQTVITPSSRENHSNHPFPCLACHLLSLLLLLYIFHPRH